MSLKSLIQVIILIVIFIILGGVYLEYFAKEKILVDQTIQQKNLDDIENKEVDKKDNKSIDFSSEDKLAKEESSNIKNMSENVERKTEDNLYNSNKSIDNNKIPSIVKDVEYLTTDKNGNKYKIIAKSGKTNEDNKNILDLKNVKGEILSKDKSTIYIMSNFAKYNSSTLGSKFYGKVTIDYEDKRITCENLEINMDTNIAIAYDNVVLTDQRSTMKTQKIILNIDTKEVDINPNNDGKSKVEIKTKQ